MEKIDWSRVAEGNKRSSMCQWFPKVQCLNIPMPKTIIIEVPQELLLEFLDPESDPEVESPSWYGFYAPNILKTVRNLQNEHGVFIRTDLSSGKHSWDKSCFISAEKLEDETWIWGHLSIVIEENECASPLGLPYKTVVVREFIPLAAEFTAFSGMPVAPERRYFVKDGEVLCHHSYWVEDAVERGIRTSELKAVEEKVEKVPLSNFTDHSKNLVPRNWRKLLQKINTETPKEIEQLSLYAWWVGEALGGGYWSVDFALGKDGKWYLIDLADGVISWHPPCAKLDVLKFKGEIK